MSAVLGSSGQGTMVVANLVSPPAGKTYEGPANLARQIAPEDTMMVPGDFNTATRLRD